MLVSRPFNKVRTHLDHMSSGGKITSTNKALKYDRFRPYNSHSTIGYDGLSLSPHDLNSIWIAHILDQLCYNFYLCNAKAHIIIIIKFVRFSMVEKGINGLLDREI